MNPCRKRFTYAEQQEILAYAEKHSQRQAAEKFGCSRRMISLWKNPEKRVIENTKRRNDTELKRKNAERAKAAYHADTDLHRERAKTSRKKRRFKRLVEMSNRFFEKEEWLTAFDLWRIAKKQKLICALTGDKLTVDNISVDHIIPKSQGGSNKPENIRLVDKDANLARRALSDQEFILLCKKVASHLDPRP